MTPIRFTGSMGMLVTIRAKRAGGKGGSGLCRGHYITAINERGYTFGKSQIPSPPH